MKKFIFLCLPILGVFYTETIEAKQGERDIRVAGSVTKSNSTGIPNVPVKVTVMYGKGVIASKNTTTNNTGGFYSVKMPGDYQNINTVPYSGIKHLKYEISFWEGTKKCRGTLNYKPDYALELSKLVYLKNVNINRKTGKCSYTP